MKEWNMQRNSSRGSTLIIALVFLLVLTVAGITAMRFSSMEETMAGNSQSRNYVFQQATSEIYWNLSEFANATNAVGRNQLLKAKEVTGSVGADAQRTLPATAKPAVEISSKFDNIADKNQLSYLSEAPCEDGSSIESFVCIQYEIDVTAQLSNGATSQQIQGFIFQNNKVQ